MYKNIMKNTENAANKNTCKPPSVNIPPKNKPAGITTMIIHEFMKQLYPELPTWEPNVFFIPINNGICERTTTWPHIMQGQKNDKMHEGTMFWRQQKNPLDHWPRGIPAISKLFGGRSRRSSSFPPEPHRYPRKNIFFAREEGQKLSNGMCYYLSWSRKPPR
jgi:hypothetical protein